MGSAVRQLQSVRRITPPAKARLHAFYVTLCVGLVNALVVMTHTYAAVFRQLSYRPAISTIITMLATCVTTDKSSASRINGFWQTFASLSDFRIDGEAD
jgi:hypothetical protein